MVGYPPMAATASRDGGFVGGLVGSGPSPDHGGQFSIFRARAGMAGRHRCLRQWSAFGWQAFPAKTGSDYQSRENLGGCCWRNDRRCVACYGLAGTGLSQLARAEQSLHAAGLGWLGIFVGCHGFSGGHECGGRFSGIVDKT